MQYRGIKKNTAEYINLIVKKKINKILGEGNKQSNQVLEEILQSIIAQTDELKDLKLRLETVERNIRGNNVKLESYDDIKRRLQVLEENTRNNNEKISRILRDNNNSVFEAKLEAMKNNISKLNEINNLKTNEIIADSKACINNTSYDEIDYFSFENYFRGDESVIRERQKKYLPYFKECNNVLDLGCGRGEFLELLREYNINAEGVDFYEEFVVYGRNKGLNIVFGDAIAFLNNLQDKTDGIYAGQLVEHLTVGQINALCRTAFDKLEEGKYLILETPNPMSLAIYTHAFYIDPSHQKPVHPLTLKYLVEKAGFREVQIMFLEDTKLNESIPSLKGENIYNLDEFNASMQKVSVYLYGSQDYAIIAKK